MRAIRIRVAGLAPILGALAHTRDEPPPIATPRHDVPRAVARMNASTNSASPPPAVLKAPPSPVAGWPNEVVVGRRSVTFKNRSIVTGDVAVVDRRGGSGSSPELSLEGASTIMGSTRADTILIARNSLISGNAAFNRLLGPGVVGGQRLTPLALPLEVPMPEIPDVDSGQTDVLVQRGETRELAPGSYDNIELRSGRTNEPTVLRLMGGMYPVESLSMGSNSRVECTAACTLVVKEQVEAGSNTSIGPRANSNLASRDIELLVQGDGDHGKKGDNEGSHGDRDIDIGVNSEVNARLYAPDGTLTFGSDVTATGTFIARHVVVGVGSRVSKDRASGCTGPVDDGNPCTTDVCTPSGEVTHTPVPAGTSCSNGNTCDGAEVCSAQAQCLPGTPVVCTPSDQCHDAGICDPATGVCSNPAKQNGTTCNDGNPCTTTDTCQGGTCTGAGPVVCTPSDQCHDAGVCDPSTGVCSNPAKDNGTTCNDLNACTTADTCQAGTCTGGSPVVCVALDQCHDPGICDPANGLCTNPARSNGTACNDGNACTQSDTCQTGSCTGGAPVVCTASDQCHNAGVCDPSTGVCSNPAKDNGTTCTDGSACTQNDTCQGGTCTPGDGVVCVALDQCHDAGVCDPASGTCSNPEKPAGTDCDDGSACTQSDSCQGGTCSGSNPVVCVALDQCHAAGICDPATGVCSNPQQPDGTACDDASACTTGDACQAGTCVNGDDVICGGTDCLEPGVCDPASGACSIGPARPDGTVCNDGTLCTGADLCEGGECVGGNPVVCVALDACHETGVCDPLTGACSNPVIPGTECPLPPDPATVAPPNDPTVATNLGDSTEFLYSGDDPIQAGVEPGTIDRRRAAVLRGRVQTREGAPLPGVDVVVHDHPEFGTTKSRADGYFDLAVNGGGFLTVAYKKEGYLPAQRQVQAPWLDFAQVPDVALVPLDPSVTAIDLNEPGLRVHRGSWMIDDDGARRMTLLFKSGTTATMTLPDCTTQALDILNVRATEYTVGPNGPAAMPAALPTTSAYTYAVELSADEALEAGATRLDFSQEVVGYLDNFLGFPVGTTVPLGFLDSGRSEWVGADNGVVIQVLESSGELADVDVDGDGLPDADFVLADLGIAEDERRYLKQNHDPSITLWRVGFSHFTPWDCNWPFGPPGDAGPPGQPPPTGDDSTDDSDCRDGCVIEAQNQTLGESIAITGTPFTLEYRSDRVLGRESNSLLIPLSGASVPVSLKAIQLDIEVAGRKETVTVPPATNQAHVFAWDGRDSYGRPIQGQPQGAVDIGYVYDGAYEGALRFGAVGFDAPITGDFSRTEITIHQRYAINSEDLLRLTRWDGRGQGLGGWTLNVHHVYDPQSKVLRLGDGTRRTVESLHAAIKANAGNGTFGFSGDGGPAKDASLALQPFDFCADGGEGGGGGVSPFFLFTDGGEGGGGGPGCDPGGGGGTPPGIAVAADGGYYIADQGNCRIRHVDPDGIIETVAGTGFCDFGFPAPEPTLETCGEPPSRSAFDVDLTPIELALGPDGDVYIVSSPTDTDGTGYGYGVDLIPDYGALASTIYRLDVETGTIQHVAGNGFFGEEGDNLPATQARLRARDLAVAPDGTLYIADTGNQLIRRVGPDGVLTTVAGDGTFGFSGDGGSGRLAQFANPAGIAIGNEGDLYVADQDNARIRRIRSDGAIETFAGGGSQLEDGVSALEASLAVVIDVAVASDGSVHYAEVDTQLASTGRSRRILPDGTVETVAGGGSITTTQDGARATAVHLIPTDIDVAPDGSVYVEDGPNNRIHRIAAPLPGVGAADVFVPSEDGSEVFVFDQAGRHLRSVHPLTGATLLSFSYDPISNKLASVTDGDGNTTTIQYDGQGQPAGITSPYGQITDLAVDANGYLSSVTNPADESAQMTYTSDGLLVSFTDPRGGLHQFEYDDEGRLTSERNPANALKTFVRTETNSYEVTETTALGRQTSFFVDGSRGRDRVKINTFPDGTQTIEEVDSDGTIVTQMPDGTVRTVRQFPDPRFGVLSPATETIVQTPLGRTSITTTSREVVQENPEDPSTLEALVERTTINGNTFESVYDAASRTFVQTSAEGRHTFETLDAEGRIIRRDTPGLASAFFSYNDSGLLESVTRGTAEQTQGHGGPRITVFHYNEDGQVDTVTAPLGHVTQLRDYDGAGRATTHVLPGGRTVAYAFDANGNITTVTPSGRLAHELDYSPLDFLSAYTPPDPSSDGGGLLSTEFAYDADNNLDFVTTPDGILIDHQYDAAGRTESVVFPSPTDPGTNESATMAYDAVGRLETLTSPSGVTLTYQYDGHLLTAESLSGAVSGSLTREYDDEFRVVSETVGGTPSVTFGYAPDGQEARAGALTFTRNPENGFLVGAALGGLSESLDQNPFGEVSTFTALAPDASTLLGIAYERDALGRIVERTETISGITTVYGYSYDAAGRLEAVNKNGVETSRYAYDLNGNRLSKLVSGATTEATYDNQDRIVTYGDKTYAHTAAGELRTTTSPVGSTTYSHDALGNLRRVVLPDSTTIDYVVDGQNRRVGKKVNGTLVQTFIYSSALSPVAEVGASGEVVSRFVYGTRINVPDYMVRDGNTYRLITDHLGSVRLVVDAANGAVAQRIHYDEWGIVLSDTAPGFQPFGFAGGLVDAHTGLVRFGAREYSPETGTWSSKDPMRFRSGSTNLYAYAAGDPINNTDIAGLSILGTVLSTAKKFFLGDGTLGGTAEAGLGNFDMATEGAELVLDIPNHDLLPDGAGVAGQVAVMIFVPGAGWVYAGSEVALAFFELSVVGPMLAEAQAQDHQYNLAMLNYAMNRLRAARARDARCRARGYITQFFQQELARMRALMMTRWVRNLRGRH